jgi:hypothetical protein
MTDSSNHLRHFAARLFEHEGALVEFIEPAGIEVMLPETLQRELNVGEFLRLGFGPETPLGAERAGLESDWLARFNRLLGPRGRRLKFIVDVDLPHFNALERMIERHVVLQNAVYRSSQNEQAWTRYLIFLFRYTAVSDEKREGALRFGFNLTAGAARDPFVDLLLAATLDPEMSEAAVKPAVSQLPADWSQERLNRAVSRALPSHVRTHLGQFVPGMQRRLDRDLARIQEYYSGLREEASRKLKKAKADSVRDRLRIEAAEREYKAKVADLKQKYELNVKVELVQTLEFLCPVHRVTLVIKRRKGERKLALDWNPISRRFDPLPCEWSYVGDDGPRLICDDQLHIVRPEGLGPCVNCGKEYCRVCSPRRCPKCGNEEG